MVVVDMLMDLKKKREKEVKERSCFVIDKGIFLHLPEKRDKF